MFGEEPERAHAQLMLGGGVVSHPVVGQVQAVVDPVVAELHAKGSLRGATIPFGMNMTDVTETSRGAGVLLLELVAVGRVAQRVGEIGKQVQLVAEDVGLEAVFGASVAMTPVGRPGKVAGIAAVGRIHVTPRRKRAGLDERERDLVARAPLALIEAQRRGETIMSVATRPG
ncbi:MAG: hypothetical protein RL515_1249 [Verrucomicrobiota bacterium]